MKRLPLRRVLGAGVLLAVLLGAGKWVYDDWPLWSNTQADPRAFQFLKNVRRVARHGDLDDISFLENALHIKLALTNVLSVDKQKYPNATWEEVYFYKITSLTFPLRPPVRVAGIPYSSGELTYKTSKLQGMSSTRLLLYLNPEDKITCLTETDMEDVFGRKKGNSKRPTDAVPYKMYDYEYGKSTITFTFDTSLNCLQSLSLRHNK